MPNDALTGLLTIPAVQVGGFLRETWDAVRGVSRFTDVPPVAPSPLALIEASLDRTFTLWMNVLLGAPQPQTIRRYRAELATAAALYAERGWLDDPTSFHRRPPPLVDPGLSPERLGYGRSAIDYDHMRFESGYSADPDDPGAARWLAFESNRTAHAYLLEHEGGPRPWIVCIHGFGMGDARVNFSGFGARWLHEELGLNVAFAVLPLHGPRAGGRISGGEMVAADYLNAVHIFAQAVWDVRRLIGWLRRERDATGIGVYGISLGGYTTSLLAGLEEGLDCVIAGIPAVDFPTLSKDNEPLVMRAYGHSPDTGIDWHLVRQVLHVVSPLAYEPRLAPDRRYIFACTGDHLTRPPQARALWRRWGQPEIRWIAGGHVLGIWKREAREFVADALRKTGLIEGAAQEAARR